MLKKMPVKALSQIQLSYIMRMQLDSQPGALEMLSLHLVSEEKEYQAA
jgi:hypothetical protein